MKKAALLLLLIFTSVLFAQDVPAQNIGAVKITQKKCLRKKGYSLVLKEVISDSRCPEGVTCVWAGEVKMEVSVYKNKKFIEDETITLSPMHKKENYEWFSKYMPKSKTRIKNISVLPYPKEGVKIDPKNYYLKVEFLTR